MIEITTGVAFLLSSMYGSGAQPLVASPLQATAIADVGTTTVAQVVMNDRKEVEKYLRDQYSETPLLVEIARCESTFSQFDSEGNVVRGRINPQDVGVMQINEKFHVETAEALGYDLHTLEGNVAYAKYLYKKQGAAPWKASSKCWAES